MWIHFSKNSSNSYGGGLIEPFRYFGRLLSDKFQSENINFPYKEIEICMAFPSLKKDDEKRKEWFEKLPHYYRGKTMIRVTLPISSQEKNLADVLEVINKAFEIIINKKKKDDGYDPQKLKATLLNLEKELQETDLWKLNSKYENLLRQEAIERNRLERISREQANGEKKKLIYDLRLYSYFPNTDEKYLFPYNRQVCEMVFEELHKNKFRLPDYTHMLVVVSDSFESALYSATKVYNWQGFGLAVYKDYADYPSKTEIEKKRIVFSLLKQGLNDMAEIDRLDKKTLNEVLDKVENSIK
nr:hypothetical protein [Flavobacterium sp. ASV13]